VAEISEEFSAVAEGGGSVGRKKGFLLWEEEDGWDKDDGWLAGVDRVEKGNTVSSKVT
jgi:hypothetical protein